MTDFYSPRIEKLSFGYFISNDYGNFVILDEHEYTQFISGNISSSLYKKLEQHDIIVNNSNKQRIINRYRASKKQILQGTSLHIVIPTKRCNMNCIYCHAPKVPADRNGFDMSIETADKVLDFIFQSPSREITIEFQGGEPLFNFDVIKHIVKKAKQNKERKLKFTVVTNLSLMNEEILDFMLAERLLPCTSLDGPEELQEKNRPNTYRFIRKWVPVLQKRMKNKLSAIAIITRHSLKYPKEIVDEYLKFKFEKLWVQPFHALGNAKRNYEKIKYSADDYVQFWKSIVDYIVLNKLPISEVSTTFLLKKLILKKNPLYVDLQSPCGAIINQLTYDYDGSVYSCDEARMLESDAFKLGNVNQSYKEILKSPLSCSIIGFSVNDATFCDACAFKPYCGICPVLAYSETNSPFPKPNNFDCKVLKAQFKYLLEKYFTDLRYKKIFDEWVKTKDL